MQGPRQSDADPAAHPQSAASSDCTVSAVREWREGSTMRSESACVSCRRLPTYILLRLLLFLTGVDAILSYFFILLLLFLAAVNAGL